MYYVALCLGCYWWAIITLLIINKKYKCRKQGSTGVSIMWTQRRLESCCSSARSIQEKGNRNQDAASKVKVDRKMTYWDVRTCDPAELQTKQRPLGIELLAEGDLWSLYDAPKKQMSTDWEANCFYKEAFISQQKEEVVKSLYLYCVQFIFCNNLYSEFSVISHLFDSHSTIVSKNFHFVQ